MDFSRAFETIDHNILISKLELYGLGRVPLNFFRNYITGRTQSTTVNGYTSLDNIVTYGTAQGSVLGPLIFIIYVNDILRAISQENSIYMYADDMLIVSRDVNVNCMADDLQQKTSKVLKWCNHNKLTINREKTKFMLISSRNYNVTPVIHLDGNALSTLYEYLGMILDNKLNMKQQIDSMYKKANMKLGILSKIRRFIKEGTAVKIYKTMIRPHLEYIDFIIESGNKDNIDRIDKLQDRALRRIEYCIDPAERVEYTVLREKYKIEPLDVRRKRSLLGIMFKQSKEIDNLEVISHDINLRSRGRIKLKNKFSGLSKLHASPYYRGCALWTKLPENVQKAENITVFKNYIKGNIK